MQSGHAVSQFLLLYTYMPHCSSWIHLLKEKQQNLTTLKLHFRVMSFKEHRNGQKIDALAKSTVMNPHEEVVNSI